MRNNSLKILVLLVFCCSAGECVAQSSLSPEQREEVRQMISQARNEIREEVRREILNEMVAKGTLNTEASIAPEVSEVVTQTPALSIEPKRQESSVAFFQEKGGDSVFDREVSSGRSGFQLLTGSDTSRASIRLGKDVSSSIDGDGVFTSQTITASAPLNKSEPKFTNIATLDGFTNSFELAYSFSKYRMTGIVSPFDSNGRLLKRVDEICKTSGAAQCDEDSVSTALIRMKRLDLLDEFASYFDAPNAKDTVYGFKLRAGHETFDYFERPALTKQSVDQVPWGISAYYGIVVPDSRLFLSASAELQQSYKALSSLTACPLPNGADYLRCVTGSMAPPQSKRKHLLGLEARAELLPFGPFQQNIGLSFKVTHDFENDETGVDLPIYLFRSEKTLLNGGLRLGWTSTDQFGAAIFVGGDFGVISK